MLYEAARVAHLSPSNCPDQWNRFCEFCAVMEGLSIQYRVLDLPLSNSSCVRSSLYRIATSKTCSDSRRQVSKLLPYSAYRYVFRLFSSSLEQHHIQEQVFRQRTKIPTKQSPWEAYFILESSLHNSNIDTIFQLRNPTWIINEKKKVNIHIPTIC